MGKLSLQRVKCVAQGAAVKTAVIPAPKSWVSGTTVTFPFFLETLHYLSTLVVVGFPCPLTLLILTP